MPGDAQRDVAQVAKAGSKTLSQLVARILEQLALSAWLPAAALALLTAFVLKLGTIISAPNASSSPGAALSQAFGELGKTSIGGIVLLVIVVVVLTMVTQAFSFESIRLLEGYWGASRPCERLAQARSNHWRRVQKRLEKRLRRVTKAAWKRAKPRIEADPRFTSDMMQALRDQILDGQSSVSLSESEQAMVDSKDWRAFAPRDLLRRRTNLEKKLEDFPDKLHIMPTRLGNVLRHYESETEYEAVESFVDDNFDRLPPFLQLSHDEQRGRLDLYSSMHLVIALVTLVAVLRFGYRHWGYTLAALGLGAISICLMYRAAVATARYYGSLLVTIARFLDEQEPELESSESAWQRWWSGLRHPMAIDR